MVVALTGPGALSLMAPNGRLITYDTETDSYSSQLPDAITMRRYVLEDEEDSTAAAPPVDLMEVPDAPTGLYRLTIYGQDIGVCSVSATARNVVNPTTSATAGVSASPGSLTQFAIDYAPESPNPITITPVASPGVEGAPTAGTFEVKVVPNPAIEGATIAYRMASPGRAIVDVYDILGRRVMRLIDGVVAAGSHGVRWNGHTQNGKTASAGLYFVRLLAGNQVAVSRFVLVH